jgi:uncharacterized protein (DUF1697 family)
MATYISLLRGINVGGQKLVKMESLRKTYESLGFSHVTTYVQSGNVIFTVENDNLEELEYQISRQIAKDFGFEVPVITVDLNTLKQVISENPFSEDPSKDPSFLHVTFLSSKPDNFDSTIEKNRQNGEAFAFSDKAVYLYCPHGYGKTKLNNNFLEALLKVKATTRNWKTANEIFKIASMIA